MFSGALVSSGASIIISAKLTSLHAIQTAKEPWQLKFLGLKQYTLRRGRIGQVFLVCNAGAGTTDLNVLEVESTAQFKLELKPLSWTEGIAVDPTLIDYKARRVLDDRSRVIQDEILGDLESIVAKLVEDQFRTSKCSFGVEDMDILRLHSPIPGMPINKSFSEHGVENLKLIVTT